MIAPARFFLSELCFSPFQRALREIRKEVRFLSSFLGKTSKLQIFLSKLRVFSSKLRRNGQKCLLIFRWLQRQFLAYARMEKSVARKPAEETNDTLEELHVADARRMVIFEYRLYIF